MTAYRHKVKIVAGPNTIEGWQSYEITHDMLNPAAGSFSLAIGPATIPLFVTLRPDTRVRLYLDDVLILDGFIDERTGRSDKGGGSVIAVSGRDRGGRLVDEAAPLVRFAGLGIKQLAEKMAMPWVERVELSNASNRRLVTGGASSKKGRVSREPAIDQAAKAPRKVNPGERRWDVLKHFLTEGRLLAWMSADGAALIVGKPNYSQEPTFRFIEAPVGSANAQSSNVESLEVRDSVAELFSQITCMADIDEDSEAVTYVKGVAKDGEEADGVGNHFQYPKVSILMDQDVKSTRMAIDRADREMVQLGAAAHSLEVVVRGHSQQLAGATTPTLYACDTIARVDSETWGISKADYLITRVKFSMDKQQGPVTSLSLVPKGTELSS